MRGGRRAGLHHEVAVRTTPACAGRTSPSPRTPGRAPDYPRVCGADAAPGDASARQADYPRVCGADTLSPVTRVAKHGLPPRVRGGLDQVLVNPVLERTTPACAGRTARRCRAGSGSADYPRVCGADLYARLESETVCGLPPRVRGGRSGQACAAGSHRTTPACAGRTTAGRARPGSPEDYPRVCGADASPAAFTAWSTGPPPRVRGGLNVGPHPFHPPRTTPACAGRTGANSAMHRGAHDRRPVPGERGKGRLGDRGPGTEQDAGQGSGRHVDPVTATFRADPCAYSGLVLDHAHCVEVQERRASPRPWGALPGSGPPAFRRGVFPARRSCGAARQGGDAEQSAAVGFAAADAGGDGAVASAPGSATTATPSNWVSVWRTRSLWDRRRRRRRRRTGDQGLQAEAGSRGAGDPPLLGVERRAAGRPWCCGTCAGRCWR